MASLKILVVGPERVGKTCLCQMLAEQPQTLPGYNATKGVRVQEIERRLEGRNVNVQLWDVAGSAQPFWAVLGRDIDGILLCHDPRDASGEAALEKLYTQLAQPAKLAMSQCMTLALDFEGGTDSNGLTRKLKKLQGAVLDLSPAKARMSLQRLLPALDKMFAACAAKQAKKAQANEAAPGVQDDEDEVAEVA
ncbi:unnamed protein product [Pedinophyceae sp. YPF-701]|nr:unnamed protein product [Pedinophyceae sp. YPF-701]